MFQKSGFTTHRFIEPFYMADVVNLFFDSREKSCKVCQEVQSVKNMTLLQQYFFQLQV